MTWWKPLVRVVSALAVAVCAGPAVALAAGPAAAASAQRLLFTIRAVDVSARSSVRIENGVGQRPAKVLSAGDAVVEVQAGGAQDQLQISGMEGVAAFVASGRFSNDARLPPGVTVVVPGAGSGNVAASPGAAAGATAGGNIIVQSAAFAGSTGGFYVLPLLHADEVQLAVSVHREDLSSARGATVTRVAGHLGQWLDLGGTDAQRDTDAVTRRLQIKVERQQ